MAVNYNASTAGAKEVVAELEHLGRRTEAVRADLARADQADGMVDRVPARFGRLDILVNNAGVMTRGQFLDVPIASYDSMFAINVAGTLLCTQRALRPMGRRAMRTSPTVRSSWPPKGPIPSPARCSSPTVAG